MKKEQNHTPLAVTFGTEPRKVAAPTRSLAHLLTCSPAHVLACLTCSLAHAHVLTLRGEQVEWLHVTKVHALERQVTSSLVI